MAHYNDYDLSESPYTIQDGPEGKFTISIDPKELMERTGLHEKDIENAVQEALLKQSGEFTKESGSAVAANGRKVDIVSYHVAESELSTIVNLIEEGLSREPVEVEVVGDATARLKDERETAVLDKYEGRY